MSSDTVIISKPVSSLTSPTPATILITPPSLDSKIKVITSINDSTEPKK
jgi:hypothetical protein